jgi:hypothetical protein
MPFVASWLTGRVRTVCGRARQHARRRLVVFALVGIPLAGGVVALMVAPLDRGDVRVLYANSPGGMLAHRPLDRLEVRFSLATILLAQLAGLLCRPTAPADQAATIVSSTISQHETLRADLLEQTDDHERRGGRTFNRPAMAATPQLPTQPASLTSPSKYDALEPPVGRPSLPVAG